MKVDHNRSGPSYSSVQDLRVNELFSNTGPASICILRLSALGDVTHVLPLVNRLSKAWPDTKLTWIIGSFEHRLVRDLRNVEFIILDKKAGLSGLNALRQQLRGRHFDALLHIQVSLRANLISTLIRAPVKIGYDPVRSRDLHGLFVNYRIAARTGEHVVDAFQSFADYAGAAPVELDWSVPIPDKDHAWAKEQLGGRSTFLISPCSSHPLRNWHADGYAQVADYVVSKYGLQVVLCGGPSALEREMGNAILGKSTVSASGSYRARYHQANAGIAESIQRFAVSGFWSCAYGYLHQHTGYRLARSQ